MPTRSFRLEAVIGVPCVGIQITEVQSVPSSRSTRRTSPEHLDQPPNVLVRRLLKTDLVEQVEKFMQVFRYVIKAIDIHFSVFSLLCTQLWQDDKG